MLKVLLEESVTPKAGAAHSPCTLWVKCPLNICLLLNQMSQTRLDLQVTLRMELERKDTKEKREELDSLSSNLQENTQAAETKTSVPTKSSTPCTSAAPPISAEALSAILHPALPRPPTSNLKPSRNSAAHTSPTVEQLQSELRELRDELELMRTQHNKEIKLLMNELDEEKRIRLTLQMEIQRMKKHMSK
ncbi:SH3 domain-containing kinase-binding protein 1 [Myripristis murdjan]|uniref:SH3 domain-containing kinase-binding protein 1 n=1 Tax=Myripristis murdjan TaxID=586833 RepID=UPI001175D778|nr:SH3 domain-containing kinase-binding protein 1-like [Myripristis murdjan]